MPLASPWSASLALAGLVACSASSPPPTGTTGTAGSAAAVATRPDEPAVVVPIPPPPPPPPPDAAPAPDAPQQVFAKCGGKEVDLAATFADQTCVVSARADPDHPLPAGVTAEIAPALVVRSGAKTTASLVLTNTNPNPVVLVLGLFCEVERQVETEVTDAAGTRVDFTNHETCGQGTGCGGQTYAVRLEAGGHARFPVAIDAKVRRYDDQCEVRPAGKIPPGRYTAGFWIGFLRGDAPITAPITVKK